MQGKNFISAVHLRISTVAIRKPTSWQRLPQSLQAHLTQTTLSPSVAEKVPSPAPLYKTF